MARLNEPVPSTESIESLKRRFMRQNRDIARVNSTQSLRIRNLENEMSRLLAENLGLREQILRLQTELENGKAQRVAENTGILKAQLETKLLEIGALINGLGNVSPERNKSPRRGKIVRASPTSSPDQKNWKNMSTLGEAVGGQEGRLPPILENKSYPRRTLEHQEIAKMFLEAEVNTTDSPEIGPPPVSQFVDEDPVKIDLPSRKKSEEGQEIAGINPALSANLEHRRRRKDSAVLGESKKLGEVEQSNGTEEVTISLKTGAKRKLSVREDEEAEVITKPRANSPDDFKFTRVVNDDKAKTKQPAPADRTGSRATRDLAVAVARGASRGKQNSTAAISNRKVLAPKSVNNSPRKSAKTLVSEDKKLEKPDSKKLNMAKENGKDMTHEISQLQLPSEPVIETIEIQPEPGPETPAGLDIFSPSSSQPSTAREESRDTPPPPDLGLGTEANRPSRRARGSVSYAEPNLRDKMRRPTKELIDAVVKDDKPQRTSIVKLEEETGHVTIKTEPESEDAWKHMPAASSSTVENSPLRSKALSIDTLPESITTHRKRRESILNQAETEPLRSSSSSAIATLLAENRRAKAAAKVNDLDKESLMITATRQLEVLESRGPSPTEEKTVKSVKEEKVAARLSKRHSVVLRDNGLDAEGSEVDDLKKLDHQRQSNNGLRSASASNAEPTKVDEPEKLLKRSASTTGITEPATSGTRSDRISTRRRSIML